MIKILNTLILRWFHKHLYIISFYTSLEAKRTIAVLECKYCSNIEVFPVEFEQ